MVLAVAAGTAAGFFALDTARGLPYFALIVAFVNAILAGRRWAAMLPVLLAIAAG